MWNEPSGNQKFYDWSQLCSVYGEATLVATSTTFDTLNGQFKSAGWDGSTDPIGSPTATATGMPLNFQVGARKYIYKDIWGSATSKNWFPESVNFRGYVDTFTMGIDYGTPEEPNVVERTFDFEPAPGMTKPTTVALNMRSICEGEAISGVSTGDRTNYAAIWEGSVWKRFISRLYGKTTNVSQLPETGVAEGIYSEDHVTFTGVYADIWDGSQGIPVPIKVRIKDPDGSMFEKMQWGGEWIGITGDVRRKPGGLIKMRYVWSCAGNVNDLTYNPE
jgi:hypothetical protein